MKKNIRLISLIVAINLVFTGLVGCGVSANDQISQRVSQLDSERDDQQDSGQLEYGIDFYADNSITNAIDDNYRNYYEIFVGSFRDSNGDGIGDLNGITEELDYIASLGCNGIWLTPMMAAPSYHKYDTTDYYMVDPQFGTNEDFKKLADACHSKGIKLIIDMVVNHSSSEHVWFTTACDYLRSLPNDQEPSKEECPYVEYYNFTREQINGTYREVNGSDWYYEAVFDYSQPDLNLYNEEFREELNRVADFWMDMGVDGFRMDAAMHYDESDADFNLKFLSDYYEYCKSVNPDFYMVSEVWAAENTIANYYSSMTPSFFNFDVADSEGKLIKAGRGNMNAERFVTACLDYQETFGTINSDYIDAPFITNHDMGRVANAVMCDIPTLKMTAGLLLTMQGSPFIYYGEEIGMKSKGKADENKRLHMNWSMDDTSGVCNDPINADKGIEQTLPPVDVQIEDTDSLLWFYKNALAIRNSNPEIARGKITIIEDLTKEHVAVVRKDWNDSCVYIIYNTSNETVNLDLDMQGKELSGRKIIGELEAMGMGEKAVLENNSLSMPAKSIAFIK